MNWTGGIIWGELLLGPAGVLNVSDATAGTLVPKVLYDDTTLHNEGSINWLGGGPVRARAYTGATAIINNRSGAFFQIPA